MWFAVNPSLQLHNYNVACCWADGAPCPAHALAHKTDDVVVGKLLEEREEGACHQAARQQQMK